MKAWIVAGKNCNPVLVEPDRPKPGPLQILVKVQACAVCRTDLHVLDGDLPAPKYPLVLGHEVVGVVEEIGSEVANIHTGERVGIPWLASTCLQCAYCRKGKENLCEGAQFTGYTVDGGFAQYTLADARFCFPIPDSYDAPHAAPLLCAGLIGWRSLRFTGDAERIGIFGFGAAAHVITPIAVAEGRRVFAFTSHGDLDKQRFARQLGAVWSGDSEQTAPEELDAAIIFAPAGFWCPLP
jgi:alcohol dehydrogenase, propanol-preferring